MKVLPGLVLVCLAVLLAGAACASDIDFGSYARSIAMGGAGLALSDVAADTVVTNPAAGAASGAKMQFIFPSVDLDTRGASLDELRSRTDEISSTGESDAIKLAEDFGTRETRLTASFATGVAGPLSVTATGEAQGIIFPGANFRGWVTAGHPTTPAGLLAAGLIPNVLPATVAAYAAAVGNGTYVSGALVYTTPSIAYGSGFATRTGKLWVGGNAKLLRSDVRVWDLAAAVNVAGDVELAATERPRLKDSGLGIDLGFIFQPAKSKVQYGMVINNAVQPCLKGIPAPAAWSVGAATTVKKLTIAADLIDLSSATGDGMRLRTGVEWAAANKLALRTGYSGKSFTWGVGIIGLNFAFTNDAPNMISKTLTF